jgi:hypothetical protein
VCMYRNICRVSGVLCFMHVIVGGCDPAARLQRSARGLVEYIAHAIALAGLNVTLRYLIYSI